MLKKFVKYPFVRHLCCVVCLSAVKVVSLRKRESGRPRLSGFHRIRPRYIPLQAKGPPLLPEDLLLAIFYGIMPETFRRCLFLAVLIFHAVSDIRLTRSVSRNFNIPHFRFWLFACRCLFSAALISRVISDIRLTVSVSRRLFSRVPVFRYSSVGVCTLRFFISRALHRLFVCQRLGQFAHGDAVVITLHRKYGIFIGINENQLTVCAVAIVIPVLRGIFPKSQSVLALSVGD